MSVPCEMLLHPELLTNEQLMIIIQERHLHIPNIERMPRDELLEVFHHYCVPFGQRKYRDSGRGKILNRTRHISPEPKQTSFNVINSHSFTNSNQHRKQQLSNCERLKPPPDLLAGHMKRIKIENNTAPVIQINVVNKRRMSIDLVPSADDPPPKKERKSITWP